MPSHPPGTPIGVGQERDLVQLEQLEAFGFEEGWIGEHFTVAWEPCPAPDLLIAAAARRTRRIRLGSLGHLLPYHNPIALAHRLAYLHHLLCGRLAVGIGVSALPTDHQLSWGARLFQLRDPDGVTVTFLQWDVVAAAS